MDIMNTPKVADYKKIANHLGERTGCGVQIDVLERDHVHYELDKMGISLGVLCINGDSISFAPFVDLENCENDQFIDMRYFPMFDEFINVLKALHELFVWDPVDDEPEFDAVELDNGDVSEDPTVGIDSGEG